jgi:hypothetical protein
VASTVSLARHDRLSVMVCLAEEKTFSTKFDIAGMDRMLTARRARVG